MIETALAPYKVGINGITIPVLIPLLRCFFAARCALYEPSQVSLISGILANPKFKIQRRSLWNLIMD